MYYTDITNKELQYFHNKKVNSFTIGLTDLLIHKLFKKVQVTDNIYKIFPLFYCDEILSTNPNDKILENKCIICIKKEKETYFTFKTNDITAETMSLYGRYYDLEDKLTTAQFNAFVSMLRHNTILTDNIHINETVNGVYGDYEFDIDGTTIIDTGIIITDETILAQPKVKLSNPVFNSSKYILKLSKLHYTGTNIIDDDINNYRVVETVEIELIEDEWVDIPVNAEEENYILNLDAIVTVNFDEVVIQDYPQTVTLIGDKEVIQKDEVLDLIATVKDSIKGLTGQTVYFYEEYEPFTLDLNGDKSIMQSGETLDLTAKLKDEDGSLVEDEEIYFYVKEE